jgi:GINS complex subunit 2
LWLAITLKKQNKCAIKIPDWLCEDYLQTKVEQEKVASVLQEIDFHYMEIANMLVEK